MASTQISITLPEELADYVRARVASGQYASASEVVQEGIEELIDRERPLEDWFRHEAVVAYDDWRANPTATVPVDEVRGRLEARWLAEDAKG